MEGLGQLHQSETSQALIFDLVLVFIGISATLVILQITGRRLRIRKEQKVKSNFIDNNNYFVSFESIAKVSSPTLQHYDAFILPKRYGDALAGSRSSVPRRIGAS